MGYTVPLGDLPRGDLSREKLAKDWPRREEMKKRTDAVARDLCANIRPADRDEIRALTGKEPEEFLPDYLGQCVTIRNEGGCMPYDVHNYVCAMYSDAGELAGVVGTQKREKDDGVAQIWMIGTTVLDTRPMEFLRASRKWLEERALEELGFYNCVDARNTKHIEWLKWLGFDVWEYKGMPYGVEGRTFYPFRMTTDYKPLPPRHAKDPKDVCASKQSLPA